MQINVGGWSLVVGMEWAMPNNKAETREWKKAHPGWFATITSGQQTWVGAHPPVADKKAYSGALLVSLVRPDAIVFYPVSENTAWVCAIAEGMPVVGHDKILPLSEARHLAIEWSALFPDAEMVGEMSGAGTDIVGVLTEIEDAIAAKSIKKSQVASSLVSKNAISMPKIFTGILICVALAAFWFGVKTYSDIRREQRNHEASMAEVARQALLASQTQAQREMDKKREIEDFNKQVESKKKEYAERIAPSDLWKAITSIRRSLPVSMRGYHPSVIECADGKCTVTWQGAGRMTTPKDKLLLPGAVMDYDLNLTAKTLHTFDAVSLGQTPRTEAKTPEEERLLLASALISEKSLTIDPMQAVVVQPPTGSSLSAVTPLHVGKWRANGMTLWQASDMIGKMASLPVRILKYRQTIGNGQVNGIEIEGDYVFFAKG